MTLWLLIILIEGIFALGVIGYAVWMARHYRSEVAMKEER